MKNNGKNFLIFLSVFLCFAQSLYAQKIGKVDLYIAVLLHPAMIDYSAEKTAFKINREETDIEKIKKNNTKIEKKRKELQKELETIKNDIKKEDERYGIDMADLNYAYVYNQEKLATGTKELNKIMYQQKSEEANIRHLSKLKFLYNKSLDYQKQIDHLDEENINYTSVDETEAKIIDIIKEIKKHSKTVASQKGISIVLNSGYKNLLPKKTKNPNINKNSFFSFGNIFTDQFPSDLAKDRDAVKAYYLGIEEKTENWLEIGYSIIENVSRNIVGEDILVGGEDLTIEVIDSIYKSHNIDQNIAKAILKSVKRRL